MCTFWNSIFSKLKWMKHKHKQTQKQILTKWVQNGIIDSLLFQDWNKYNLQTYTKNKLKNKFVQMSTKWTYHLLFQNSSFLLSFQKPLQVDVNTSDKKGQHKKTFEIENWKRKMFFSGFNKQSNTQTKKPTNKQTKQQTKKQSWFF